MTSEPTFKTSQLKPSDHDTIKDMVRVYQSAYKNDQTVQLKYTIPQLIERMSETITIRVQKSSCEFIIARAEGSARVAGWLSLIFKRKDGPGISEDHVLLAQYALVPDMVIKAKKGGITPDQIKDMARKAMTAFKGARETRLQDGHCLIGTLVVDPEYQNKGVASTLLTRAISLSEIFASPMWVPAPEACRTLFDKHFFVEAGEYRFDLNELAPESSGKGKSKAVSVMQNYVWKFMVREEPLEKALRAYRSSVAFTEEEEAKVAEFLRKTELREREGEKVKAGGGKLVLEGDEEAAGGASQTAPTDEGESSSSSLLEEDEEDASGGSQNAPNEGGESPTSWLLAQLR